MLKSGITLFVCDRKTAYKKIKNFVPEDYKLTFQEGKCLWIEDYNPIVWVNSESDIIIPILSHELIHAVYNIFELRGIPIQLGNDEIFAYTHQYLMEKCLYLLQKSYKHKK